MALPGLETKWRPTSGEKVGRLRLRASVGREADAAGGIFG